MALLPEPQDLLEQSIGALAQFVGISAGRRRAGAGFVRGAARVDGGGEPSGLRDRLSFWLK